MQNTRRARCMCATVCFVAGRHSNPESYRYRVAHMVMGVFWLGINNLPIVLAKRLSRFFFFFSTIQHSSSPPPSICLVFPVMPLWRFDTGGRHGRQAGRDVVGKALGMAFAGEENPLRCVKRKNTGAFPVGPNVRTPKRTHSPLSSLLPWQRQMLWGRGAFDCASVLVRSDG